jgi:hypothetical protein
MKCGIVKKYRQTGRLQGLRLSMVKQTRESCNLAATVAREFVFFSRSGRLSSVERPLEQRVNTESRGKRRIFGSQDASVRMSFNSTALPSGCGPLAASPPKVTIVRTMQDLQEQARSAIKDAQLLALDCEGVDLSRIGSVCIVQVSTPSHCFLFDVLGLVPSSEIVVFLKTILEDRATTKIIHDCKMDSDALHHLLGIRLAGVHDTQVCDVLLRGCDEYNLNQTLEQNGCRSNVARNSSVYESNPKFWSRSRSRSRVIY